MLPTARYSILVEYFPDITDAQAWVRRGPQLVWEELSTAVAVFDSSTGETHFLNELPALLLPAINDEPASQAALVNRLAGPLDLDGAAEAQVFEALMYLKRAELVESVSSNS